MMRLCVPGRTFMDYEYGHSFDFLLEHPTTYLLHHDALTIHLKHISFTLLHLNYDLFTWIPYRNKKKCSYWHHMRQIWEFLRA